MNRSRVAAIGLVALLAPTLAVAGTAGADPIVPRTGTGRPIDIVIQRALSQRGVPYVYGGGTTTGPTTGARPGIATAPRPATQRPGFSPVAPASPGLTGYPATSPAAPVAPAVPGYPAAPTAGVVGFDSSGLIQYAYAGAGIKMPRTSGEQCNVGRKVPTTQARPGDLMCYGPGGSQSVAMYLGNGQMIEGTSPAVTVSPARTSNMVPYLTRILD